MRGTMGIRARPQRRLDISGSRLERCRGLGDILLGFVRLTIQRRRRRCRRWLMNWGMRWDCNMRYESSISREVEDAADIPLASETRSRPISDLQLCQPPGIRTSSRSRRCRRQTSLQLIQLRSNRLDYLREDAKSVSPSPPPSTQPFNPS